jgi:hypothetical protein
MPRVLIIALGPNAIQAWRDLIGPTHLVKVRSPNFCATFLFSSVFLIPDHCLVVT